MGSLALLMPNLLMNEPYPLNRTTLKLAGSVLHSPRINVGFSDSISSIVAVVKRSKETFKLTNWPSIGLQERFLVRRDL